MNSGKKSNEMWNGVEIIRIPLFARGKTSAGMVLNYFSFVVSGFFWKVFIKVKADLVFTFEVSPMTQALIGVWYSKKRKKHKSPFQYRWRRKKQRKFN